MSSEQTAAEIFWDYMQTVCPLSEEELQGIFDAKNQMPKKRPKAKTNLKMREKNKIHSDIDYRFVRVAREAIIYINIQENAPLSRNIVQHKLPLTDPYRCGVYLQLFYMLPWKEYCLFFPSPWLRNLPNRSRLMEIAKLPDFLAGRKDAVDALRNVIGKDINQILPSFDTLSDYGIQVSQYLLRS